MTRIRDDDTDSAICIIDVIEMAALMAGDPAAAARLTETIISAADPDDIKVMVLRICSEAAPSARPPASAEPRARIYSGPTGLCQTLAYCRKPVVAQVRGDCDGIASLLALFADITVADSHARFFSPFDSCPEANFVIAALTIRLERAKAWMLSAEPIGADVALEYGLINEAVSGEALDSTTLAIARRIARIPLDAITVSKMNINACLDAMASGMEFDMSNFFAAGMATPHHLGAE